MPPARKLRRHRVQAADAKVDHPSVFGVTKVGRVFGKRSKYSRPRILPPRQFVVTGGRKRYSDVLLIPTTESRRGARPEVEILVQNGATKPALGTVRVRRSAKAKGIRG
jgi:hypothetical protein